MSAKKSQRGPGRPALFPELGVSGLKRYSGYVYDEFLSELRGQRGMRVYREIRDNSAKIGAALGAVELAALGVNWWVEPGKNDADAPFRAEFVDSCRNDMSFTWRDTLREAMTMLPFGFAPLEIVYKRRLGATSDPRGRSRFGDQLIGWRKLPLRAQETVSKWEIDAEGGIQGLYQQAPPAYASTFIPIEKLLLFRTRVERNNPEGRSVLRNAYESYFRLKRLKDTLCIGVERDLNGIPVAWVPPEVALGATDDSKKVRDEFFKIVKNLRQDEQAGLVLPSHFNEGGQKLYDLQLLTTTGRRQFDLIAIIEYFEACCVASILYDLLMGGQPNSIQYRGDSQPNMFSTSVAGWLDVITDVFNAHAIPRLYRLNGWSTESCAQLRHGEAKAADIAKLADFVSKVAGVGLLHPDDKTEQHLRRLAGLPEASTSGPLVPPSEGDPEDPAPDDTDAEPEEEPAVPATAIALRKRLEDPRDLRMGEFARIAGFSREHARKLVDAEVVKSVRMPGPKKERRVPVAEVSRLVREGVIRVA